MGMTPISELLGTTPEASRHPEVDYYDDRYLVLLTSDVVNETEFSRATLAAFRSAGAALQS